MTNKENDLIDILHRCKNIVVDFEVEEALCGGIIMSGYSCQEEYDYYMQAEAEAQYLADAAEAESEEIISALQFLLKKGVEPNHYKAFYEQNKFIDEFRPFE